MAMLGLATVIVGVTPRPASAHTTVTAVVGNAFGYHADEMTFGGGSQPDSGPAPTVTLASDASNSPQQASVSTSIVQVLGVATILTTDSIVVNASGSLGPSGTATTNSTLNNVNKSTTQGGNSGSEILTADSINSTCTANGAGVSRTVTITNGTLQTDSGLDTNGDDDYTDAGEHPPVVVNLPVNPSPGQSFTGHIHIGSAVDDFQVILNEQASSGGASTVTAVHERLGTSPPDIVTGHLYLGRSTCGVTTSDLPNNAPVANDDSYSTPFNTPLTVIAPGVLQNDTDQNGDAITAGNASNPPKGSVTLNGDGSFTYTPDNNATGADTFTYTTTDAHGSTDTATVTVTIGAAPNTAPNANNDSYNATEDTQLTVNAASGVLANDTDTESAVTAGSATDPPKGSVTLNSDGSFTYTPDPNTNGSDSFTYTATDTGGLTDTATVTINVAAVNDPPNAVNDSYNATEDTALVIQVGAGVLANDTDVEAGQLTASNASNPPKGTVALNSNGSFTYTPDPNTNGSDSFTYTATDPGGATDTATVTINVAGVNDAPDAVNDSYSTPFNTPLVVNSPGVLGNDTDVEGALTASNASNPPKGSVTLNGDGSFSYTPDSGATGSDSFTYTVTDTGGLTDTATVSITIGGAPNTAPNANNDSYNATEDTPLTVTAGSGVLANDTDNESGITAGSASNPPNGSVTLNANGSFTYTPDPGFSGSDSFTYLASDTSGATDSATVSITVGAAPPASADFGVSLADSPDPVTTRSQLTYTLVITNNGPSAASGVVILNRPKGTRLVSTSGATCTPIRGKTPGVSCVLRTLNSGASTELTIVVRTPSKSGTITATARVSANATDSNPTNNSASAVTAVVRPS